MIASGSATLRELQTFYSVEDCYDMLEVVAVSRRNQDILYSRRDKT